MNSRRNPRRIVAAVLVGVLAGGGLMATTPAGAEVAESAATNWKKIWKKNLQQHADKRYYKKSAADARYASKGELGNVYTKGDSDARYQPKGSYAPAGSSYTKAESDGKYVAKPALITGGFYATGYSEGGSALTHVIDFGANLSAAPVAHYVETGATPPAVCPGTASAPDAAPGHLCVYETGSGGLGNSSLVNFSGSSGAENTGTTVFALPSGAGVDRWMRGRWAVRPGPAGFNGQGREASPRALAPVGVGGSR